MPRPAPPDPEAVHAALVASLREALAAAARAAAQSREAATHEEARAEGDKDMRSTEQSYVARGQAMRAEDLAEQLARLESFPAPSGGPDAAIEAGALLEVAVDDEAPRWLYLVPWGGGTELAVSGARVTVVTPASPLGRVLLGRRQGDEAELVLRGASRGLEILRVRWRRAG